MEKVVLGMTMSLDGFINDRNGSVNALYPDLTAWRETESGKESMQSTGAMRVMELPGGGTHLRFSILKQVTAHKTLTN